MAGVTSTGLVIKILREILDEVEASEKGTIDPAIDVASARPLGQFNGVFADREAALWELLRVCFNGFDPDQAEGYLLDALCSLTGTVRKAATPSLVTCTVNLDAGVTLPAGSKAHVVGQPTRIFQSRSAVTSTTAGNYSVQFESVDTGPVPANAGTLTVIAGPVTGWNSVTNPTDASPGTYTETDAELRLRRVEELQTAGGSTPDAIRSDLLKIDGVEQVTVFENLSDFANDDGVPAHSIEVLVYDGVVPAVANDTIAQAVWNSKAAGVRTYGNTYGTAVDAEGTSQTVYFSRPVIKYVYVTAVVDAEGVAPADATTLLRDYLVSKANADLNPGGDVIALALRAFLLETKKTSGYTWVNDVPTLYLGFAASPTLGNNLPITVREIARLDTANTSVTLA